MVLENVRIYRFRWLLYEMVKRDLKLRYRGSVLGVAWTLLNPILFMGVYTLVFSVFMKSTIEHYPLFLLSGLIPWMWFSSSISQSVGSVVGGGSYIGKTLMPAELLVLVPVLSNGVNFLVTMLLFLAVSLVLGVNVIWAFAFLPALIAIELFTTIGISMLVATVNVFFRDLEQIVSYVLTAAFFLTPIFYTRSAVPENLQFLVTFNPLAGLIGSYQAVLYRASLPGASDLLSSAAFCIIVLIVGCTYFNAMRDGLGESV